MNKKILISASIITLILLLVGGYFYFTQKNNSQNPNTNSNSPFGSGSDSPILPQGGSVQQQTTTSGVETTIETKKGGLRKISSTPVSDGNFVSTKNATGTPVIRFIERATGHIYEANLDSGVNTRITNTTIPKIEQVKWSVPGKSFLAQYISDGSIKDTFIEIGSTATSSNPNNSADVFMSTSKFELPPNIISASFNLEGTNVFYLTQGTSGVEGYVSTNKGEKPTLVWQFPTTEWLSQWIGGNMVTLTSKASNGLPGIMYNLDTKTKSANLILSEIPGLTTNTSPKNTKILYTKISGTTWETFIYDTKYKIHASLPFVVLPQKCIWSKDEITVYCARSKALSQNAPDDWYQGLVSFTDTLWKINLETLEQTQISDLHPDDQTEIDVLNPHLSQNEDYLIFTNKKDLSLWAVPTK